MTDPSVDDGGIDIAGLENEMILLSRHALQRGRRQELDRSAYLLLGRLDLTPAMSLRELTAAVNLDGSTVNRQVGMLERKGLVERMADPDGGVARKIRPTTLGLKLLHADRESLREGLLLVVRDWPADRVRLLGQLLLEFNVGVESLEGRPWPRPS